MKKLFKSLFVVIAATATFVGCQKEENNAPATQTKTVEFFANSIETKTQFGESYKEGTDTKYPTLWTAGDVVTVLVNLDNVANTQKQAAVECSGDFKSARFEAALAQPAAESFTFYSVSPSSALISKSSDKGYLYVEIPAAQTPLETSVDKKAQVLYAASATSATMPSSVDLDFHHLTAYGKFSLANLTDQVKSVSKIKIEAPEDVYIAGKWDYFVANGSFVVREGNGSNAITLTTTKTSDIWFAAAPAATAGKTIKFTVTTDKGDLVKEVTFPGNLVAGNIATFTVNMAGINPPAPEVTTAYYKKVTEAPSDWSGTYVLGYTNGTTVKVLSGKNSAGNYGAYTDLTLGENGISSASVPENCVLTIEPSANGYTLFVNNTYLGYTSTSTSGSNYLYFASSIVEKKYEWTISLDGSNVLIKSVYNTGRTIKWNATDPRFACYTSAQTAIQLYRLEEENSEPEQPKVLSSIAVSGQKTEYYVGDAFEAPTVTATYEGGKTATVTATFTGNDLSEAGTRTVTATYTENGVTKTATYEITVIEVPAIVELTVAEFLAAEKSDVVWYQLTGIITEIASSDWGNITIKDESASVYIYGLTKEKKTSNDKSFSSLGLKVGDQVTLVTVRGEHNGTAQGGGTNTPAYYVTYIPSCVAPTISCADNKVTISAETGATIYYTTDGTTPTEASTNYTAPFDITETVTIKAIAVATGKVQSSVAEKSCTWVDLNAGDDESLGTPATSPCYTMETTTKGTNSDYTKNCDVTINGVKWNVTGNAQMAPWRIGGKNLSQADRAVYTKTAYSSALSKVDFQVGTSSGGITWNSLKLIYSTNEDFSDAQTITITSGLSASKTYSFAPEGGFPANCYFKFVMNVTVSTTSSNKYYQLSSIKFYGYDN